MKLRNTICWVFIILIALCILRCEVRNPAADDYIYPEIQNIITPSEVALQGKTMLPIYVKVSDPQGLEDIATVSFALPDSQSNYFLQDSGNDGDLIPGDGMYTGYFLPDLFGGQVGNYQFQIKVEDLAGNISEAVSDTIRTNDGLPNNAPVLWEPVLPDTVVREEMGNFNFSIHANDAQGLENIDSLVFQIYMPLKTKPVFQDVLLDDGAGGDAISGDGVYSITIDLADTVKGLGTHQIRFQAKDKNGNESLPLVVPFFIAGINDAPELSNLNAPFFMNRLDPDTVYISIRVTDPQGPGDVRKVYFNSMKPYGFPARGNPFILLDDGNQKSGDAKEGDGIYSIGIVISSNNELGAYTFTFYAEDIAGYLSEPLVHPLIVIEEKVK